MARVHGDDERLDCPALAALRRVASPLGQLADVDELVEEVERLLAYLPPKQFFLVSNIRLFIDLLTTFHVFFSSDKL